MIIKWSDHKLNELIAAANIIAETYYEMIDEKCTDEVRKGAMLEIAKLQAIIKERGGTWIMPRREDLGKVAEPG